MYGWCEIAGLAGAGIVVQDWVAKMAFLQEVWRHASPFQSVVATLGVLVPWPWVVAVGMIQLGCDDRLRNYPPDAELFELYRDRFVDWRSRTIVLSDMQLSRIHKFAEWMCDLKDRGIARDDGKVYVHIGEDWMVFSQETLDQRCTEVLKPLYYAQFKA